MNRWGITIDYYKSHSSPIYLCYVDASKAFDRINFWHMSDKLLSRGLPTIFVRLFVYWFTSQNFSVKWCNIISAPFKSSNGLRQGGILSPLMFNVYVDDLSSVLRKSNVGCHVNDVCINHLFYADDAVLMAPSPYALQKLIDVCESFANDNEMTYNDKKTVCMNIMPHNMKNVFIPNMYLNGKVLKCVTEQKYLGIFITSEFSDNRDITRQIRSTYSRGNVLISKFRKCSNEVKVQLFSSFCSNLYCSSLWSNYRKDVYNRLRVAYNNVFRILMGLDRRCSISYVLVQNNVVGFHALMRKNVYSLRERVFGSDNTLIHACTGHNFFIFKSTINKQWCSILY